MRGDVFKKIGAAVTMVAMMASVGFTASADIVDGTGNDNGGVSATVAVEKTEKAGIYAVTVDYTTEVEANIGVTMLAYADTVNGEFTDATTPYAETGMQIVGIKQNDGATAEGDEGTFEFLVNTNEDSTNSGMIRMDVGDVGIVLVSSDGATAPTGYLFTIPDSSFTVADAKVFAGEMEFADWTVPYGIAEDDILDELSYLTVMVYGDGGQEEEWTATWEIDDYSATTPGTYNAVGTLVKPSTADGKLDGNVTTVTVLITVEELAWDAASGTMEDVDVVVPAGSDVETALKAAVVGKVITLTDANEEYTAEVEVDETIADTLDLVEDNNYTVTVAQDTAVDDPAVTVPEDVVVSFTANVTYEATEEFTATSLKAFDAEGEEVAVVEVENGASEEAALEALADAVTTVTAYGVNTEGQDVAEEGWTVTSWEITEYNGAAAGNYIATATLQEPDNALADVEEVTLTVTVKVKAPAGPPADLNGNNAIDSSDLGKIKRHVLGTELLSAEDILRADLNGNNAVDSSDLGKVKRHVLGTELISY